MSLTNQEARDSIVAVLGTKWAADAPSAVGYAPGLAYDNVKFDPPSDKHWARLTIAHNIASQRTFGAPGKRRFQHGGIVTLQIFVLEDEGLAYGDLLAEIAVDAFEGVTTPEGFLFRNVRTNEVGSDHAWFQINVTAEFEYGKLK